MNNSSRWKNLMVYLSYNTEATKEQLINYIKKLKEKKDE